jgi:tetratricopeptide (TPR) repeat protein
MAKKKLNRKPGNAVTNQPKQAIHSLKQKNVSIPVWMIPAILLITIIAYIPVFNAQFVTLDDGDYVTNNYMLKDLSHLKDLLTTTVQGNYHPLTMLSLAFNYQLSGMEGWSYHILNLLLHLLNCILVFRFVFLLTNRNVFISFTTALLFGIHPMHVESVAWISERKDVLYAVFFLLGLISYTRFVDTASKKQYWLSVIFLILALLSKPAAVIFPLAIFCIDLLRKRKLNFNLIWEKTPFFILALAGGIGTLLAQRAAEATGHVSYGYVWPVLFGFYGIMMYIIKLILPFGLAAFYPFPAINENLGAEYYFAPLFFIGLAVLFYYGLKKNRLLSFGISFYIVNLLLVLQFLPVGSAIIADRYTYIPYIGLFLIVGWSIEQLAKKKMTTAYAMLFFLAVIFAALTFRQARTWHDGATLWDQAIQTHPSSKAYANRALLFRKEKNYPKAIEYYRQALRLNKIDHEAFSNLANVYFDLDKPDSAFLYYNKALSLKPDYVPALDNMGAMFAKTGEMMKRPDYFDSAVHYLSKAIAIKPDYKTAYSNRAATYMNLQRYEEAIKDFEKYLLYEPKSADIYNSIGVCYQRLEKYPESLTAYNKAIELNRDAIYFLNRSFTYYYGFKNAEQARQDAKVAQQAGMKIPEEYAKLLGLQ